MHSHSLPPADWLVETKLHPPLLRAETVARPRLQETLCAAVTGYPLTLVSAPAGSGKTTLLASLRELLPAVPLAWLSLDAEDNDPARFLAALAAALGRLHPALGAAGARAHTAGGDGAQVRQAITALINEAVQHLPDPTILVLDDLHLITEPAVHVALSYLVERMPPQLRLVIGTRHDPPLPLARLAARRQLVELRRADLSFTTAEATELLNATLGLNLSPADLAALQERTEGWAAGLCLLASSLHRIDTAAGRSAFLTGMAQSDRYVFDFLAEEVLRAQEPTVRTFLLQTAVLAELTSAACQAVTGRADAGDLLEALYRRNLFLVATGDAYRYHALFAEFLRRQLARELPGQVADLHLRAATAQASPARCMVHYLGAGAWESAARTLEQIAPDLLTQGLRETLRGWYAQLPADVRAVHPLLALQMGGAELARGDFPAAQALLTQAQQGFAAAGDRAGEGAALATLTTACVGRGDFTRVRSLALAAQDRPLAPVGRVQVAINSAHAAELQGDWSAAAAHLVAAVGAVQESGDPGAATILAFGLMPALAALSGCLDAIERFCERAPALFPGPASPLAMAVHEVLTYVHLWRGRTAEAIAAGAVAEELRERRGGVPHLGYAGVMHLGAAYALRGDLPAAERCADLLLQRALQVPAWLRPLGLYGAGRLYWQLGRPAAAAQAYLRLDAATGGDEVPLVPLLRESLGGLLALGEGQYVEAERRLARAVELEQGVPSGLAAGSARLLLARLYVEQERGTEALDLLQAALAECAVRGMPGLPLVHGTIILPVLHLAASRGVTTPEVAGLLRLLGEPAAPAAPATPAAPAPEPPVLPEPLTPRELEVLRLILAGASNRDIGEHLYIGLETVKTHVTRILRKLDVTSRTQAIARARELGF